MVQRGMQLTQPDTIFHAISMYITTRSIKYSPDSQEHEKKVVAKLATDQATLQCPNLWFSARRFKSMNYPNSSVSIKLMSLYKTQS